MGARIGKGFKGRPGRTIVEGSGTGLRLADLSLDGHYEIPDNQYGMYYNTSPAAIAVRRVAGKTRLLMFTDYNAAQPGYYPLAEYEVPASAAGASQDVAPNLTFVRDWGYIMNGHVVVDGSSGTAYSDPFHPGRLMWDENNSGVWWTYGGAYVPNFSHPTIGFTHLNDATGVATSYGPWRINSGNSSMVRGQMWQLPTAWANAYNGGRRFAVQGHMNSGIATTAHGPNLVSWAPFDPFTTAPTLDNAGSLIDGAPYVGGTATELIRHDATHKKTRNTRFRICGWIDSPSFHEPGLYEPQYGGWVNAESNLWGGPEQVGPYNVANGTVERDSVYGAVTIDIGGTHSVLFYGALTYTPEGYSPPGGEPWVHMWYGNGGYPNSGYCTHGQPDPHWTGGTGVGGHYAEGFGWVYDIDQFLPVIGGSTSKYDLTPAVDELKFRDIAGWPSTGNWTPPAGTSSAEMPYTIGAMCYEPNTRKIYMMNNCDYQDVFGQFVLRRGIMVVSVANR
jgi:hypothetical protein